jgi:hypothetical protein
MTKDLKIADRFSKMVLENHEAYVNMPHPIDIDKYLWEVLKKAMAEVEK